MDEKSSGMSFSNFVQRLRVSSDFDPRFAWHFMNSSTMKDQVRILSSTTTGLQNLSGSLIREIEIPRPPIDEQRRIADFLDAEIFRIDQLHDLMVSVLERLDQRDRAARDRLIDKIISIVGTLPLSRFSSKIEQGSSPSCVNSPREPGEWGVIKLSAVKRGRFFPEENKKLPDDVEPVRQYELRNGDLLASRANTPDLVGDVAVVEGADRKLLLPDLIYRIGLDPAIKADFAAQVFLSTRVRGLIQSTARGSSQSMVKLRGEDIRQWPVPKASEQQQRDLIFAMRSQLDASATLGSAVSRQLSLLAERRQAIITAAITGQFDVTTARGLSSTGGVSV